MLKIICHNRKAHHDYFIEETIEAGIALKGTEVKSLRQGKANLRDSYVIIKSGEVNLFNCHISPYSHGNIMNHEPLRTRKLLLHRKEIERLGGKVSAKGYALIPLKLYFKDSFVKVEIGLAKGKKLFEKRDIIKKREAQREIEKALRGRKGSTEVMRIRSHAVVPSPRKKAETTINANNELALAA